MFMTVVKPDNILINRTMNMQLTKIDKFKKTEDATLIDFGLAIKYLDSDGEHLP